MRILRVLQSQSLSCGCFVGVYETYEGKTVTIVDEPGAGCREDGHKAGQAMPAGVLTAARGGDAGPGASEAGPRD